MPETRNTLFLYPKLENYNDTPAIYNQNKIIQFITDLKLIVNISNRRIEKILRDSSFAYIKCLPNVSMEEIHANSLTTIKDPEHVRICVIKYDDMDYEEYYCDLCEKYKKNQLQISHLVALKISSNSNEVKFVRPEDSPFDVIIETGLGDLKPILVSILLDISIYHYFSLSNDLGYRREFFSKKLAGINESPNRDSYGSNIDYNSIKYLPFSYPYVKKIIHSQCNEQTSIVSKLICDYFDFIKKYLCKTIKYTKNKELLNPYDGNIQNTHRDIITSCVKENSLFTNNNNYYVFVKKTVAPGKNYVNGKDVIAFEDNDNALTNWLSLSTESLTEFSLYYIMLGV